MSWVAVAIGAVGVVGAITSKRSADKQLNAMNQLANRPQKTALGSFFNPGGTSGLAPSIQGGRAELLANLPGYKSSITQGFGNFQNRLQETRSELVGNESQFMQSGLNPIRQRQASAEGALTRDLSRRGIEGSSFANTARGNQQATFGREMSDATAQIRNQQLAQRLGIDEAELNAGTNMISNLGNLDQQAQSIFATQAAEQLNLLGLSQSQIANMLQVGGLKLQNQQTFYNQLGRTAMGIGGALENRPPPAAPPVNSAGFN